MKICIKSEGILSSLELNTINRIFLKKKCFTIGHILTSLNKPNDYPVRTGKQDMRTKPAVMDRAFCRCPLDI